MATAIVRHAGARYVVVTDVNPYRLELAAQHGRDRRARRRARETIADAQKQLGMKEGFDVGLEMSGNAAGLPRHAGQHVPRRQDRPARHPAARHAPSTGTPVIFNGLTIKGIYGREMYETWYKMTVMIQGGLDITPVITHRFHYTEFERGFEVMRSGESGKVVLSWES